MQKERGCYSAGEKSRHCGWWGGQTNEGGREKEDVIQDRRADMIILKRSAQPKKSESLNQIFSQSLTENFLKKKKKILHTGLHSIQSKSTKDWYSQ